MAPYYPEGNLTTETREVAVSETWETQSDWDEATETQNVEVVDGSIQLVEYDIPDSVVDNFEAADADPTGPYGSGETINDYYGGDTDNAGRVTSTVFEGSYSVEINPTAAIVSTSGLPRYLSQGDSFGARVYLSGSSNDCGIVYGVSSEAGNDSYSGYLVTINNTNDFRIFRVDSGSATELESDNYQANTQEWYRIEVTWGTDDSHQITLFDDSDTQVAQTTTTDDTYTGSGVGFRASGTTMYADLFEVF